METMRNQHNLILVHSCGVQYHINEAVRTVDIEINKNKLKLNVIKIFSRIPDLMKESEGKIKFLLAISFLLLNSDHAFLNKFQTKLIPSRTCKQDKENMLKMSSVTVVGPFSKVVQSPKFTD